MKKVFQVATLGLSLTIGAVCHADYITCDNLIITDVTVEADRDDQFYLANTMLIRAKHYTAAGASGAYALCGGKSFFHLEYSASAYSSMLSIALAAQASGTKVEIGVNTNKPTEFTNPIAIIHTHQ